MSQPTLQRASGVIAVLHPAGGGWRVLVANVGRARPAVLEARELPADAAGARQVHDLLRRHGAGRVVTVLPASSVVCRTCTLPLADPAELDEALRLQAEAAFVGRAPAHRLAMAVLEGAPGETSRCGIILSWPEAAPAIQLPAPRDEDEGPRLVIYAPDVAALVALLNGHRPPDPLMWIDRHSGSVAMAITHASGAVFRCLREDLADTEGWTRRVAQAMGETALRSGHSESFVVAQGEACEQALARMGASEASLSLPPEIIQAAAARLEGAPRDDADWWRTYGIAVGILLATTGELAPRTALRKSPETVRPSPVRRVTAVLSRPRAALATVTLCLVLLGLTPLAMAGLRLGLLKLRYEDIDAQVSAVDRMKTDLAMYGALEENAWSMTKLLSDIVVNTPEGIELVSIRLLNSDSSFAVSGEAIEKDGRSARENVRLMQENLRDTRIFGEIKLNWGGGSDFAGKYDFELSAKIKRPHLRPDYPVERRYDLWTLQARNEGDPPPELAEAPAADDGDALIELDDETVTPDDDEGARVAATPEDAPPDEPGAGPAPDAGGDEPGAEVANGRTRLPRPLLGDGGSGTNRSSTENRQGSGPGVGAIPEPISKAQIDAMSPAELRAQLITITEARLRLRSAKDEEMQAVADRLQNEFQQIKDRLVEIQKEGGQ